MDKKREEELKALAIETAQMSPAKKRKVGAVIAGEAGEVITIGYNNNRDGSLVCEDVNGNTLPTVEHAEVMAIREAKYLNILDRGRYIYVTHPPCENCQKAIDEAGLEYRLVDSFMKFDKGKLRYGLIPPQATKAIAQVLTYGAKKYKPNNWQLGEPDRYVDALYRHLEAWRAGEKLDPESGLSHLAHAITNISFLIFFEDKKQI